MSTRRSLSILAAAILSAVAAPAAPVTEVVVAKLATHAQAGASTAVATGAESFVDASFGADATGTTVTLTKPGGGVVAVPAEFDDYYSLAASYASTAEADAAYPDGTYTMAITGASTGTFTPVVPGGAYPAAPRISNFAALQAAGTTDVTVSWDAFAGGSAEDLVMFRIEGAGGAEIYSTPSPGEPGALDGTATSVVVPTLPSGSVLEGTLEFYRYTYAEVGGTDVYGAKGVRLTFPIVTTGAADATPPQLLTVFPADGATGVAGNVQLVLAFNEPMSDASSSLSIAGPTSVSSWESDWSLGNTVVVLTLPVTLADGTYTVTLNTDDTGTFAFRDLAGNALAADTVATTFTVGASVPATDQRLVNISTRGYVQGGDNILIGGFVSTGSEPRQYLVRGGGPSLGALGVPGTLADPRLRLFSPAGAVIAESDDWSSQGDADAIEAARQTVGGFPYLRPSTDSAILITLDPGAYTFQLDGKGGVGVGIVEVYEVP